MTMYRPAIDPPEPAQECTWCDGNLVLPVASVLLPSGQVTNTLDWDGMEAQCPHCQGTGEEPEAEPDPDRQRDEAREQEEGN